MPRIDLGYRPRPWFVPFHARRQRWACIVAHRRAGKSVASVMDLVDAALRCERPAGRFAYMAPTYSQAKDIAWAYLKGFTAPIPGIDQRESDLSVILPHNGARIRLYGSDHFDRLRGGYLDGAVLDEFQLFDPRAWPQVIRPSLADRQGWATMIGTPNGPGQFKDLREEAGKNPDTWYTLTLKASETGILSAEELADMRRTMSDDAYQQEMECSFEAAIRGAIYRNEIEAARTDGRIAGVPFDPAVPVWTAWDLGIGDATAIWCAQVVGREIHLVDYYENTGQPISHYLGWLDEHRGWRWALDLLPHDGRARELGTGKTIEEQLRANGRRVKIGVRATREDAINAARTLFARCWFDAARCARGLECLSNYRREFNDRMGIMRPEPVHDWTSHGSDAFSELAMGLRERLGLAETKPAAVPSDPWERRLPAMGGAANGRWMGI